MIKTNEKERLRKQIKDLKEKYSHEEFTNKSEEVFSIVEITGFFQQAKTIFIYNNLSDEVATKAFITKWRQEKDFYFPAVVNDSLVFRRPVDETGFQKSSLGILEPMGLDCDKKLKIDLIIVPGVAFDRKMNRLGRGKGYYDRFLSTTKATKMGVCYDFQLLENVPTNAHDIKMDVIISENDLIW